MDLGFSTLGHPKAISRLQRWGRLRSTTALLMEWEVNAEGGRTGWGAKGRELAALFPSSWLGSKLLWPDKHTLVRGGRRGLCPGLLSSV